MAYPNGKINAPSSDIAADLGNRSVEDMKVRTLQVLILAVALQTGTLVAFAADPSGALAGDRSHDFDFNFGTWKTHIRRLVHPLSGSTQWDELDGTVAVHTLWGGKAQYEEIEADGAHGHFEGLTIFLYDAKAQQWSQYFANSRSGALDTPVSGSFKERRGEFYGQSLLDDRFVLVRMIWTVTSTTEHHVEQSFSADGGRTWEANFIGDLTATTETPRVPQVFADPAQHDFDWQLGNWAIHMRRMLHPMSASEAWTTYDGTVTVSKLWNGRANLAEITASGKSGTLQFLSLRLYNPRSHEWTLNFAHAGSSEFSAPMYGRFHEARGEFYDVESLESKSIIARFVFDGITTDAGRDEQAFSPDGGRTWEINWINRSVRTTRPGGSPTSGQ